MKYSLLIMGKYGKRFKQGMHYAKRAVDRYGNAQFAAKAVTAAAMVSKRKAGNKTSTRRKVMKTNSYTKTKTKKRKEGDLDISQHNDMSYKSFKVHMYKKKMKTFGRYLFSETAQSFINTETEGTQAVVLGPKMYMVGQQLYGLTSANRAGNAQYLWGANPYKLNPYSASDVTNGFTAQVNLYDDRFYIKSLQAKLSILSVETIPQRVKILWCKAKRNGALSPDQTWAQSITTEALGTATYGAAAVTTTTTATVGAPTVNSVGQDPRRHKNWNKQWSVCHEEAFVLQPGDQRHFQGEFEVNKMIIEEEMRSLEVNGIYYIGGMTIVPMLIVHGGLVAIADTAATPEITYGRVGFGLVANEIYTFAALPVSRVDTIKHFQGLVQGVSTAHDATAGIATKEALINDTDNLVTNVVAAFL